jgi:hypothetical protein
MRTHAKLLWQLGLPVIVLAGIMGIFVYAHVIEAEAASLLKDVSALRVGISTAGDVQRLAVKQKRSLAEQSCEAEACFYSFEISNKWLSRLRLEPMAKFRTSVEIQGGVVEAIHTILARNTGAFPTFPSAGIVEESRKTTDYTGAQLSGYRVGGPVGKPYLGVGLGPTATAQQRQRAYAFSLQCLTKIGNGCDLPCDYLPLAWKDWEAQLGGFGEYYPNRARCR